MEWLRVSVRIISVAVRPNADIEIGHLSATLAHLSNILAGTGRQQLNFNPNSEQIVDAPDANALLKRD